MKKSSGPVQVDSESIREEKEREQWIKCQGSHGSIVIWWGRREEVVKREGGCLNLGNRPGKPTGVHKFTVALLGHCTHTLSLTHHKHTKP